MTRDQLGMFEKMLAAGRPAKVGKYTFTVSNRNGMEYQLEQCYGTSKIILKIGTFDQCMVTAKECFEMMFMNN